MKRHGAEAETERQSHRGLEFVSPGPSSYEFISAPSRKCGRGLELSPRPRTTKP